MSKIQLAARSGPHKVTLSNLQVLRAFAATNVVMFHSIGEVQRFYPEIPIFGHLAGWGGNGVDVFFVLSGFVIEFSHSKSPKRAGAFLRSRLIRIVPNYWAWTLALFAALLALPHMFSHLEADFLHLLASMLFVSEPLLDSKPFFYVGWTLEYEMLFYLLFMLSIASGPFLTKRWLVYVVIFGLAIAFGLPLLALEFLFGMLIARAFLSGWTMINPAVAFSLGMAGLLTPLFVDVPADRLIVSGMPAALLVHGAVFLPQISNRTFEFLGEASYSIYLVQVISIPVAIKLAKMATPEMTAELMVIWVTSASLAVGAANYVGFERPLMIFFAKHK